MGILRTAAIMLLAGEMVFAFQVPEDPVLKARTQRAQAQGISEGDLPPVPRVISEPPPLPAPETNYKDTRKGKSARKGRSTHAKKGHSSKKSKASTAAKHPKKKPN